VGFRTEQCSERDEKRSLPEEVIGGNEIPVLLLEILDLLGTRLLNKWLLKPRSHPIRGEESLLSRIRGPRERENLDAFIRAWHHIWAVFRQIVVSLVGRQGCREAEPSLIFGNFLGQLTLEVQNLQNRLSSPACDIQEDPSASQSQPRTASFDGSLLGGAQLARQINESKHMALRRRPRLIELPLETMHSGRHRCMLDRVQV